MKLLLLMVAAVALATGCSKTPPAEATPAAPPPKSVSIQDDGNAAPPPPVAAAPEAPADGGGEGAAAAVPGEIVDLTTLRTALQSYMAKTGKTPDDLNDLVKAGYFKALPVAPDGYRLFYDPITVSVSMVKKW